MPAYIQNGALPAFPTGAWDTGLTSFGAEITFILISSSLLLSILFPNSHPFHKKLLIHNRQYYFKPKLNKYSYIKLYDFILSLKYLIKSKISYIFGYN